MTTQYRPRYRYNPTPVVVEAVRYTGQGPDRGELRHHGNDPECYKLSLFAGNRTVFIRDDAHAIILGETGPLTIKPGYWLVKDDRGYLVACSPEEFEQIFEPMGPEK